MIEINKINPDDLKIIIKSEQFRVEEIGNKLTGEIHNEMFIDKLMTVDEIICVVKKYNVEKVWYRIGTDRTHTFPLIIKMRDVTCENKIDNFGDVEFSFPIVNKSFLNNIEM